MKILLFSLLALFSTFSTIAQSKVLADGATLKKLPGEYAFTEGPATDKKGNVYFTDQPNDKIYVWKEKTNTVEVYMDKTGRSNGLYFDKKNNLWACADEKNELWQINKNKQATIWVKDFEGKKFNGPNDLWIAPNGGIYFTDPFYKRPYWDRTNQEIEEKRVYYLSPDRKSVTIASAGFVAPNGIIGTPDGKMLYVADIGGGKTYSFGINEDGTLTDRKLFCSLGSDGMTIDKQGNVYLTGKGVTVFDKTGTKIEQIDVPEGWTANVTIGGKKRNKLFITASKGIYAIEIKSN